MDYSILDRKPRIRKIRIEDISTRGHALDDQMARMVFNTAGAQFEDTSTRETEAYVEEPPNREAQKFFDLLEASLRPLYEGCKMNELPMDYSIHVSPFHLRVEIFLY
ncbi:hypothetical protein OROHE_002726 [Orobanche hederae]